MKADDAYTIVNVIGKFGSKRVGNKGADTHPDISKTTYSDAEVICIGENVLRKKWTNREVETDGESTSSRLKKTYRQRWRT